MSSNNKNTNKKIEFEHSLIIAILESSPDGILVVDENAEIVSHNHRLFDVFGISPYNIFENYDKSKTKLDDKPLLSRVLKLVKNSDPFLKKVKELYENPHLDDVCEIELKDGRTIERHSSALWGKNSKYLGRVWFFRDITERKKTQKILEELSLKDPLTGVSNRRHFFERASQEFERSKRYQFPLSFIMIDLDHFKSINDNWGHAIGDEVLKNLCNCSTSILRKQDIFCRIGGEEFAIIAPNTDSKGALELAERIRQYVFNQRLIIDSNIINYSISLGVSNVCSDDTSEKSVLKRADSALYTAKNSGRNLTKIQ